MIRYPRTGQRVELHYADRPGFRAYVGLHLALGTVVIAGGRGGPVNALVRLDDGRPVCVPRGHLVAVDPPVPLT